MSARALGVALVHYRTPELVRPAVVTLAEEAARAGLAARILLVDNGSAPAERAAWDGLPCERIDPGANLGYAGGVARALAAENAPTLWLAMNPDVVVRPGCIAALVAALDDGADAAGPRFAWDAAGRLLLPPAEERTRASELLAALAPRFPAWARRARRRWRRHARRHWEATRPLPSFALSGALLAFRRSAWDAIGPFDAAYRLYFEESDWLERLRRAGRRAVYVPAAAAWHLYARSTAREPQAAAWFAEAARRFRRRAYGAAFAALLAWLERSLPVAADPATEAEPLAAPELGPDRLGAPPAWVEISPLARGFPAAAERLLETAAGWALDAETRARAPREPLFLRVVAAGGEERAVWTWKGGAA